MGKNKNNNTKKKGGKGKFFLGALIGAAAGVVAGRLTAKDKKECKGEKCEKKATTAKPAAKKPAAKKTTKGGFLLGI